MGRSVQAERRDREMARRARRKTRQPLPSPFSARLVGVSKVDGYPQIFWGLEELMARPRRPEWEEMTSTFPAFAGEEAQMMAEAQWEAALAAGPYQTLWLTLRREPDNEHDPNAISVEWDSTHLGYLNRVLASRLAPELDAGISWLARIEWVAGDPGGDYGCSIRCKREE